MVTNRLSYRCGRNPIPNDPTHCVEYELTRIACFNLSLRLRLSLSLSLGLRLRLSLGLRLRLRLRLRLSLSLIEIVSLVPPLGKCTCMWPALGWR